MSPAAITLCASLLCVSLTALILAGALYWVAQAVAVLRGTYDEARASATPSDDDDGEAWKRGGRR